MGCVASKKDINDLHPNIFQVMNVDQSGHQISPGQLEITETDLVLYQRKKPTVKWPLRRLRRYGFEREIFSFESGRRCPTGQGIYAFHCLRADQLFNLVQAHIQVRNIVGDDGVTREFPAVGPVPMPINNASTSGDSNYLEPAPFNRRSMLASQNGGNIRRLGSVGSSNGPLSPQGTASPSPPPLSAPCLPSVPSQTTSNTLHYTNEEHFETASALPVQDSSEYNNNKPHNRRTYMNSASVLSTDSADDPMDGHSNKDVEDSVTTSSYINVEIGTGTSIGPLSPTCAEEESNYARLDLGTELQPCHLYMNVVPGQENGVPVGLKDKKILFRRPSDQMQEESRRCYANLEPSEIEVARSHLPKRLSGSERLPPLPSSVTAHSPLSPPPGVLRQVNYIVLDLDKTKADIKSSSSVQQQTTTLVGGASTPESSGGPSEGYATIDFNKTVALSHSVNPNVDNDSEGSRKTRHNSTINDLVVSLD